MTTTPQWAQWVSGWDATGENLHLIPAGLGPYGGGYLTGSAGVAWDAAQQAQFPHAVLFDQSPVNTPFDTTCDAFDCETFAVTMADLAPGLVEARAHFKNGTRPGQRWPAVYQSANNLTPNVNDLLANGITSCPMIVANFSMTQTDAIQMVATASGPFPIVGAQFSDQGGGGAWDLDIWSLAWLQNRSKKMQPTPTPTPPPTPVIQEGWAWCHKCQGLFWNPNAAESHCPAGGIHEDKGSYNYVMLGLK